VSDSWTGTWWALALRATAALIFGIIAFTLPGPTLAAVVMVFGAYAIVDGVFAIIAAVRGIRRHERWGAMLFQGIAGIAAGVLALFFPLIGALGLTYLVAAWALVTGSFQIAAAITLRKLITGEWLMILGGVLSIGLAVLMVLIPAAGILLLAWWIGAYAIVTGAVGLALAFRVREWSRVHA
jgi:uncharacterized membrane protein HdeD (DUF308 family)